MYLVRYKQVRKAIVLPLRKQCEMNCNLDTREYSLKFLRGKTWSYTAGVADLKTKKPMKADFRFRIGSVTKTFIATVLLQLSGENRLNLDDSIEKWLPGVIQGNGYDGNQITIRQILNHTSGIADYINSKDFDITDIKIVYG